MQATSTILPLPTARNRRRLRQALLIAASAALASCAWLQPRPPGVGEEVDWRDVPGWGSDHHAAAWPALTQSCRKLPATDASWRPLCRAAAAMPEPDDAQARRFFETWFTPHAVNGKDGSRDGLITGYYEPELNGSLTPSPRYRFPIYKRPHDLLEVDLDALFPELAGKRVRGRLEGTRVVPYYSRKEIDDDHHPLAGNELLWVDDAVALFFLHIQGSGRVRLSDGRTMAVGYADQNGHPYTSIGRKLVDMGAMPLEDVSLFSIRAWLLAHPEQAESVLNANASYVFFTLREATDEGPVGSLNVPLTPQRSIAVDRTVIPLGLPVWLDTTLPDERRSPYRRLVFAQDTGGAISGPVRADLFWGRGERAERMAGEMRQKGRLYVLLPKTAATTAGGKQ